MIFIWVPTYRYIGVWWAQIERDPHNGGNAFICIRQDNLQLYVITLTAYIHYDVYVIRGESSFMEKWIFSPDNNFMKNIYGICFTKEEFSNFLTNFVKCTLRLKGKIAFFFLALSWNNSWFNISYYGSNWRKKMTLILLYLKSSQFHIDLKVNNKEICRWNTFWACCHCYMHFYLTISIKISR